jgi:hypothetical protein
MDQIILFDNDALLKLARYGLLDESIHLFRCNPTKVRVLATAKYKLLPLKNRLRFCEDEESAARLESFLEAATPIDIKLANPNLLDALNAIQNIDAGEAILFAISATDKNTLIITGDKTSLLALYSNSSVTEAYNALEGRIVTMEILFSYLIEHNFSYVQNCVRSQPKVDKALSIAFGISIPVNQNLVREGLDSYIQHLRKETGSLLYPVPH